MGDERKAKLNCAGYLHARASQTLWRRRGWHLKAPPPSLFFLVSPTSFSPASPQSLLCISQIFIAPYFRVSNQQRKILPVPAYGNSTFCDVEEGVGGTRGGEEGWGIDTPTGDQIIMHLKFS